MSRAELNNLLAQISKYGLSTVLLVWLLLTTMYQFLIPIKDGHLKFLERTAGAVELMAQSSNEQKILMKQVVDNQKVLLERTDHRWTSRDMEAWAKGLKKDNPDIEVAVPKAEVP